jgi:DNA-binding CsgD family transcriptional regulator
MSNEIVGRDQELRAIKACFGGVAEGPAALLIEGEAGIGKTTLWRAAVEAASADASSVLVARPAEAERDMLHSGLGDLLEGVVEELLPAMPAPRRQALEGALLLRAAEGPAQDGRALAAAVQTALRLLAEGGPVVVAIDDVQWLDSSSLAALEFAFRRLHEEPVLLVLTRRIEPQASLPLLARALPSDRVERVGVGPLSLGAIQRLLQTRLARTISRRTLVRLHEVSGGNPFYALELAHALGGDELPADPGEPMTLPETLEAVVRKRLEALPDETNAALLTLAALGAPSVDLVRAAGVTDEALEPAYTEHVIECTNGQVRYTHPLLASAVYAGASLDQRARVHRALAKVVVQPLSRARHLALGSSAPDESVATALERAAALARAGGAVIAAAELTELAVRSTPEGAVELTCRRKLRVARDHIMAGDAARAAALARELLAQAPPGPLQAEALALLGELDLYSGNTANGIARLERALEEAADTPALQARIHEQLAFAVRLNRDVAAGEDHVNRLVELAEQLGDLALRARALATLALLRRSVCAADALRHAHLAGSFARASGDQSALDEAYTALGDVLLWTGRFGAARRVLSEMNESASERNELISLRALFYLSQLELWVGRWDKAADHAERCREIGRLYALDEGDASNALYPAALVAAHRDDPAVARKLGLRGLELAEARGQPLFVANHRAVLGTVSFREGEQLDALAHFEAVEALRRAGDLLLEPNMRFYYGDYVEALLGQGRIDDAAALVEPWAREAQRLERPWALAHAARCRGLVAAARGNIPEALRLLEEALQQSGAAGPFGTARAALALGIVRRRARQKRKAREAFEQAMHHFDLLGAPYWSRRAAGELARVGGRVPAGSELTPAERRVAELVGEGKTNREVAALLFIAERTVEGHLSHIYAKLGVRSRTELSRRLP